MTADNKSAYKAKREVKVSVKNLTKKYGDLLVLDNINFDIYKGELLCIVGPTGCGKTTFLNCLSRFIPITEGTIDVDGVPADPHIHNIAFVFQEVSAIPWLTVEDNIRFGLRIKRLPEDEIEKRVERMLDIVGLTTAYNIVVLDPRTKDPDSVPAKIAAALKELTRVEAA